MSGRAYIDPDPLRHIQVTAPERPATVKMTPVPVEAKARKPRRKVLEPGTGIEPATRSLQNCRSTTELSRPYHSLSSDQEPTKQWPALMTLKVAQEYSGLGKSKLKQLIAELKLPTASPDTTTRVLRKDLDALMESCRR